MFKEDDLLSRIYSKMPDFSKGQKKMAAYLSKHYEKAAHLTASKLGTNIGVSESTVVRFAYELGYEGYPEFQKALDELIRTNLTTVQRIEVTSDRIAEGGSILKTVLQDDAERIKNTLISIDEKVFNSVVKEISLARRVFVVGGRSSFTLAKFLGFYLDFMIDNVKIVEATSIDAMFEEIHRVNENDLLIAISFPRYSNRTLRAMEYAHSQGATLVAITDSDNSPLNEFAHYTLKAKSDMVSFIDSLVAPMSVINALLVAVSMTKKEEISRTLDKLETIWKEYQVYRNK